MSKRQCKYCSFCECKGRANQTANKRSGFSRKYYYCMHRDSFQCHENYNGDYHNFIGYGDKSFESPLQLKTTPKWCPLE